MKERLVICNEEDTDGRARVTRDEERVLAVVIGHVTLKGQTRDPNSLKVQYLENYLS